MAAFLRDNTLSWWPGYLKLPGMVEFPGRLAAHSLASWTISFEFSAIMVAAGAIIGMKVAWSMLAGGILNYFFLAPYIFEKGIIPGTGYKNIVSWSLWAGLPLCSPRSSHFLFPVEDRVEGDCRYRAYSSVEDDKGRRQGTAGLRVAENG